MKKLLSAVTSLVMAATFVSSAFTSSLVVSAAGSVPAVQPNVSMDGVKDVTANKNASNADFVFDFNNPESTDGYWHAKAGESVDVDMHVTANQSKKVSSFSFEIELEGGITVSDILDSTPAFNTSVSRNLKERTCAGTCEGSDGHGIIAKNGTAIMYTFDVPDGTPDGLYAINITKAQLSGEKNDVFYENVEVQKGYIQVGEGGTTATTKPNNTTTTNKPDNTTTTKQPDTPVTGDFVFDFDNPDSDDGYWHANAGESVDVDMHVTAAQDKKVS
ncbi:MAG: hypothetical protein K2G14_02835, partial [Ruminococcus sp.]|nr:hypothetical protein [Ruminococcus sp.]